MSDNRKKNETENQTKNEGKNSEKNYESIEFETADGEKVMFSVLEQTMLGGINYLLVTEENEEGSFLILKEINGDLSEDDYASYEILEDEKELRAVAGVFDELLEDVDLEV
jgi:hypothetical protein